VRRAQVAALNSLLKNYVRKTVFSLIVSTIILCIRQLVAEQSGEYSTTRRQKLRLCSTYGNVTKDHVIWIYKEEFIRGIHKAHFPMA